VCYWYSREHWLCSIGTVGNIGSVLWLLKGTVAVCCGYCREKWLSAVVIVVNSGCVLWVL